MDIRLIKDTKERKMKMEGKESIKISLSGFLLIVCLIVIVIMTCVIYSLKTDKIELKNSIENLSEKVTNLEKNINNSSNNIENVENEIELEVLNIEDELVEKLYGYVLKSDNFDHCFAWQNNLEPASFYRKTKVTYEDLSDIEKTIVVLENYTDSEIKIVDKAKLKGVIENIDSVYNDVRVFEKLSEKSNEIFNQTITKWNEYDGLAGALEYKDDNYYLIGYDGGGKGTSIIGYSKLQKAEKDEENIYIYDKFMYVDSTNMDLNENDSKIHIYTTSDKAKDVGQEKDIVWGNDQNLEKYYEKYENELNTFKHTFKKAENGNYYWLSTEICD